MLAGPAPAPDKVKDYSHHVLELGLTYVYFLKLCKMPNRDRMLALFKVIMMQLKSRSVHAKYPLEILQYLFLQYSLLTEQVAHQTFHAGFVNTKGKSDTNIPADQQMEAVIKKSKRHIRHMCSNKNMDSITAKTAAMPAYRAVASNFEADTKVVIRSKKHKVKDAISDELIMIEDLHKVRPFRHIPGRHYEGFENITVSPVTKLNVMELLKWIEMHKRRHIARV